MNRLLDLFMQRRGYSWDDLREINDSRHGELKDMDLICEMLYGIRERGEHIVVLPDFDTDGVMSGVCGMAGLSTLGFRVSLFRPTPAEGYGFRASTVDRLLTEFPDVDAVITCDVGITCYEGVDRLKEVGVKVLITDHHVQESDGGDRLHADVIIDPNRTDETYRNKGICGAHVMWQVLDGFARRYSSSVLVDQIWRLRVFAGIGTVSDVMPLVHENRDLVRDAVDVCRMVYLDHQESSGGMRVGLNLSGIAGSVHYRRAFFGLAHLIGAFIDAGKLRSEADLDEQFFGFYVAPTFNAVKRMEGDMGVPFGLFFGDDPAGCAQELLRLNEERKACVAHFYEQMRTMDQPLAPHVWVVDAPAGVLGLLATKVINETHQPTMVLAPKSGGAFGGSGRSPAWYRAIDRLSPEGFYIAGHQGAFGIGVSSHAELCRLSEFLEQDAPEQLALGLSQGWIKEGEDSADIRVSLIGPEYGDIGLDVPLLVDFLSAVEFLKPFGRGFEAPVIEFVFSPDQARWRTMGSEQQHVKASVDYGVELIAWNSADELPRWQQARQLRAQGRLGLNEFRGSVTLNFFMSDVRVVE